MRWSYPIFRIKGISIELHLTFILFFLLILLGTEPQAVMFFLMIFTVVLAHELVHSLTAIFHGVRVPRITLTFIGGFATIELPDDPLLELKVSIVGPLFNLMLAGVGIAVLSVVNSQMMGYDDVVNSVFSGSYGMGSVQSVLSLLVSMNLVLGVFNLLPAFPMDGGRVFRGVLCLWMDYTKATRLATLVGWVIFLLMIPVGVFLGNPWLVIIGLFLPLGGIQEVRYLSLKALVAGVRLRDIAVPDLVYVNSALSWADFLSTVYRRGQGLYLTVDDEGALEGVFEMEGLGDVDLGKPVGEAKRVDYTVIDGDLPVSDLLKVLFSRNLVLVALEGKLVGYVTPQTLGNSVTYAALRRKV